MPSIHDFLQQYRQDSSRYGMPEFQRTFEWDKKRIESFFDSVFRMYPLPRFFTWTLPENSPVGFYKFADDFSQKGSQYQGPAFDEWDYNTPTIAVCDGQQRLTSLLIGLQGKGLGVNPKYLYMNIFHSNEIDLSEADPNDAELNGNLNAPVIDNSEDENEDAKKYKLFQFLSEANAERINAKKYIFYIKVERVYSLFINCNTGNTIRAKLFQEYPAVHDIDQNILNTAVDNIYGFRSQLKNTVYLDFQQLDNIIGDSLDEAVEFFTRINSRVKSLSPNDILFALLSKYLIKEQHDFKLKEEFYEIIKNSEIKLKFDFLLRTCLYINSNNILFNINSFNETVCIDILNSWTSIKRSIQLVFEVIKDLSATKFIVSSNSLIPLIYHYYKKGNTRNRNEESEILNYLMKAQFSGVFGSHGDSLLTYLRNNQGGLYVNANYLFNTADLIANLPNDKSFTVGPQKIADLLEKEYGSKETKALLQLVSNRFYQADEFHVDHIHPASICSDRTKLMPYVIADSDIDFIMRNYNKLPNLQLLNGHCNISKNDTPILEWVRTVLRNAATNQNDYRCLNGLTNEHDYFNSHLINIPAETSTDEYLHLTNFEHFYNARKELLKNMLNRLFNPAPPVLPHN